MTFNDVSVVVLAGGRGTRISQHTQHVPKPLLPVAGRPFLYWLTTWIAKHGPKNFIYSTGYLADQIGGFAADGIPGLNLKCVSEKEPLGTGGGLFNCLDHCSSRVLVLNGDGLIMGGISDILELSLNVYHAGIIGVRVDEADRFGTMYVDGSGCLEYFREKVPGRGVVNTGVYLFKKDILKRYFAMGAFSIEIDLIPKMIADGLKIKIIETVAPFIDIGTPDTLGQAKSFIEQHRKMIEE